MGVFPSDFGGGDRRGVASAALLLLQDDKPIKHHDEGDEDSGQGGSAIDYWNSNFVPNRWDRMG